MKFKLNAVIIAMAAATPWLAVHAQTPADMQKQIQALQEQLKALQTQVQQMGTKPAVDPVEFNRMVQKMEVNEDTAVKSGFSGLAFKGVIEGQYLYDKNFNSANGLTSARPGFSVGNGYAGNGMFEITKQAEGGEGINWTLRLTPGGANVNGSDLVHEASVSVPLGSASTRLLAGVVPDWQGYEYSFGNQNPLVTHNLLFNFALATNYTGAGIQHTFGPVATKFMLANIDKKSTNKKLPGFVYNAYWTVNEFSYANFSGAHSRRNDANLADPASPFDLVTLDGGYSRGDLALNGQISVGRIKGGAGVNAFNALAGVVSSDDAKWYGLSGFTGYKVTPRLQAIARYDYINNRKNGGGMFYDPSAAATIFGPELDAAGAPIDVNRGTTRSALSLGLNYAVNPSTQWKNELRLDRSSGFNFLDANGQPTKSNTSVGTAIVVSF